MRFSETCPVPRSGNPVPVDLSPQSFLSLSVSPCSQKPLGCGWDLLCCFIYGQTALHPLFPWMQMMMLSRTTNAAFHTLDKWSPPWAPGAVSQTWGDARSSLASVCLAVTCKPWVPYPLDLKILLFASNLSKLTCLLVTTRGIPYNVIKVKINMGESQLSQRSAHLPLRSRSVSGKWEGGTKDEQWGTRLCLTA